MACAVVVSAQTNLVTNGDFEEWDFWSGNPVSWSRHPAALVEKNTDAQNGTYSAQMEADDYSNRVAYITTTDKIALKAGETYNCSFYYKITEGTLSRFEISLMHYPSVFPEAFVTKTIEERTANVWHKYEFSYTETTDREIDLDILFWTSDALAHVLIDNVSFTKVNSSSIENSANEQTMDIYPNPASEYIIIDGNVDSVELYNVAGKLVKQTNDTRRIDISSLPAGIYTVTISKEGKTSTSKLIKK